MNTNQRIYSTIHYELNKMEGEGGAKQSIEVGGALWRIDNWHDMFIMDITSIRLWFVYSKYIHIVK